MKLYLRVLSYAQPFGRYILPYLLFTVFAVLFSVVNVALLVPILRVLFEDKDSMSKLQAMAVMPQFDWSLKYLEQLFNAALAQEALKEGRIGALYFVAKVLVASVVLTNIFRFFSTAIVEIVRSRMVFNLRQALFDKVILYSMSFFGSERKGDLMTRLSVDVGEVENHVSGTIKDLIREPLTLVAYVGTLVYISWELTIFSVLVIPISGGFIGYINKRLRKDAREGQDTYSRLTVILDEALGAMKVIQAFNAQTYIRNKFHKENKSYTDTIRRLQLKREASYPLSELLGILVVCFILLYGGQLVLSDNPRLSPEGFIAYLGIFSQVLRPAKTITASFSNIQKGLASAERVFWLMDQDIKIKNADPALPLPKFNEQIAFHNVSFAYDAKPVLDQVSFEIKKGETIALVGPSGGGKSTTADLITRIYDVSEGSITIDGVDIRLLDLRSLRSHMGVVTQDTVLFNDTIMSNIAFAKTEATEAEVIAAAKIANADNFIMQMENGYHTMVGDRGMKLSGGQRQRISIARAVLMNPDILILDEATSALDTESERLVQDALTKLMANRTSLVIAHRLSTIQHADKIIVIDKGKVVEQGNHSTLLENKDGLYYKLNLLQTVASS